MDRFIISNAGIRIPPIIYGTAWKKDATERLVRLAIRNGFRGIDTACQPKDWPAAISTCKPNSPRSPAKTRSECPMIPRQRYRTRWQSRSPRP
jgi:hypothetical protein